MILTLGQELAEQNYIQGLGFYLIVGDPNGDNLKTLVAGSLCQRHR